MSATTSIAKYLGMGFGVLILLATVLVLVNNAAAQIPPTQEQLDDILWGDDVGSPQLYLQDLFTNQSTGSIAEEVISARFSNQQLGPGTPQPFWIIDIQATYQLTSNSNGIWNYTVTLNDEPIPECQWEVETISAGGFLSDLVLTPHFSLTCSTTAPAYGLHWLNITRTIGSGTPSAITSAVTNVVINALEFVIPEPMTQFESLTGFTGLELVALLAIAVTGILIWSKSLDDIVIIFGAVLVALPGTVFIALSGWAWSVTIGLVLLVISAYLLIRWAFDKLTEGAQTA